MKAKKDYKAVPLSFTRKMVMASVACNKKTAIHCLTEMDVTKPRRLRQAYYEETGEKLSFTAYIVRCFAEAIKDFPEMNSFIKGNKLVLLDDINISVMIEREIDGLKTPEPLGIHNANNKTIKEIHDEIREAQGNRVNELGGLSGATWIRFVPGFLMRTFIRIADRNISMAKRYGKIAITAVGMYTDTATWFIPHGSATVLLTVGSLKTIKPDDGTGNIKEMLHLTASFDHDIIDGAPAARFMKHFGNIMQGGDLLQTELPKS